MIWPANKSPKKLDPVTAFKAEIQRISENLVAEIRAQYERLMKANQGVVDSLARVAANTKRMEARQADLERRIEDLERDRCR